MNIHFDVKIYISFYILSIRARIILLFFTPTPTFPKDSNFTAIFKILVRALEMLFGL